jgi:hypothetical protein
VREARFPRRLLQAAEVIIDRTLHDRGRVILDDDDLETVGERPGLGGIGGERWRRALRLEAKRQKRDAKDEREKSTIDHRRSFAFAARASSGALFAVDT